jgi:hypothetical protein
MVFMVDLLDRGARASEIVEKLYLISKDAGSSSQIDLYWRHKEATSRSVVAQLLLAELLLGIVRRQLRSLFPGLKVSTEEIGQLIRLEVLKRDVLEGDRAIAAEKTVKKAQRRRRRAQEETAAEQGATLPTVGSTGKQPAE